MSNKDNDTPIKMQIKARLRLSLLKSEAIRRNNNAYNKLLEKNNNIEKYFVSSNKMTFSEYTKKANSLKKLMLKMSIGKIYTNEKNCSIFYNNIYENLKNFKKTKNLPEIENYKKSMSTTKIKKQNNKIMKNIRYNNSTLISTNNTTLFRNNNLDTKKNKKLNQSLFDNKLNKNEKNYILLKKFLYSNNFSLLKGGAIKYNNSIFRNKKIKQLYNYY